jgi:HK97 gp10 family phage protein
MNANLTITGMDALMARFGKLAKSVDYGEGQKITKGGADELRNKMKDRAPMGKTGNLKRGIISKNMAKSSVPVSIVVSNAKHSRLVEYGHAGPHPAGPHPYFRPTVDSDGPRIAQEMRDKALQNIKRATR